MDLAIVLVCGGLIFYTLIGYPIVIAFLAKRKPIELAMDQSWEPTISVLMSVHNAEKYLAGKLSTINGLLYPQEKIEILIYNDDSFDKTADQLEAAAAADGRIKVITGLPRLGKPTGLNQLAAMATGEVFLMTDVRQEIEPASLRVLLSMLADPTVGTVAGNLVLRGEGGSGVYWRYEEWLRDREARYRGMVGTMGSLYVIRKADFADLPADTILDDMWIPLRLRLLGKKLLFTKAAVAYDEAFEDDREFGRKARTLTGNYQIFFRMPELLSPSKNPSFFETLSHKVLRLLLPWSLLALLQESFNASGRHPLIYGLFLSQVAFYALALVGPKAGKPGRIARTFTVMQAATVVGLYRYVRGSQSIAW